MSLPRLRISLPLILPSYLPDPITHNLLSIRGRFVPPPLHNIWTFVMFILRPVLGLGYTHNPTCTTPILTILYLFLDLPCVDVIPG
jgi:hypothetical protein